MSVVVIAGAAIVIAAHTMVARRPAGVLAANAHAVAFPPMAASACAFPATISPSVTTTVTATTTVTTAAAVTAATTATATATIFGIGRTDRR